MSVFTVKIRMIALTMIVAAFILFGPSCTVSGESALAYVPANSAAIVMVDWPVVAADPDLKRMINGREAEITLGKLGIKSESITNWLVFATLGSESGIVISGDFDSAEVERQLSSSGWTADGLDGVTVYSNAGETIWIVSNGMIVAGTKAGIRTSIKTAAGERESIETVENFLKMKGQLATEAKPLVGYLIAPKGTLEAADAALKVTSTAMSLFGMGELGSILNHVNVASGTGIAVGKNESGTKCSVDFCVLMRDEGTAAFAAGALSTLKGLSSIVGNDADRENLESFEVTQDGHTLSIRMEMPAAALIPRR